jgi:4'-phosphopantetheinyl transferase
LPERDDILLLPLSQAERARAARFATSQLKIQWSRARFALRSVLARYLGIGPEALVFETAEHGKPFLLDVSGGASPLEFNLSHSGEHVLVAVAWRHPVGVDIEAVRAMDDADAIVERNFSPLERAAYRALPAERRLSAFFDGWTRKEAFIKAEGQGLHRPLKSFSVSLDTDARLIAVDDDPAAAALWTLVALDAPKGYAAALAVNATGLRLLYFTWPERV